MEDIHAIKKYILFNLEDVSISNNGLDENLMCNVCFSHENKNYIMPIYHNQEKVLHFDFFICPDCYKTIKETTNKCPHSDRVKLEEINYQSKYTEGEKKILPAVNEHRIRQNINFLNYLIEASIIVAPKLTYTY